MAGDEDLMEAMAELVVADTPAILTELKEQFDQNEAYEAASTAHKLKVCSVRSKPVHHP